MTSTIQFTTLFLSTPSARRATCERMGTLKRFGGISIHALREEGDQEFFTAYEKAHAISIHALREEGDVGVVHQEHCRVISIHALREEGDR